MTAFIALLRKDLVLHFSNRRAVILSFFAPIFIAAFFGSLFGGSGGAPSGATTLPLVRGLLMQHVLAGLAGGAPGGLSGGLSGRAAGGPAFSAPFTTKETASTGRFEANYNGYAHSFAGMGVQFLLLMGVDMGLGLLLMRRMGLWQRLRAAPLSRATLLGSRIASGALITLIVFAGVYAVAYTAFGVRVEGSVAGFVAVLLAFSLLTATFGLLIAAIGRTPEATRGLAILATLLMVMLGGAWVPTFIFPPWLQQVALFVPTYWAVEGLDAMTWRGLPFNAAVLPVGLLLAFSAAFAGLALWRFDWEE